MVTPQWTHVNGWESPQEQGLLASFARLVPEDGLIVEIGSEHGMSASIFRTNAHPNTWLFCVEINPNAEFLTNMQKAGISLDNVKWINESSHTYEWIYTAPIDLLFVDGDHSELGAFKDIDIWSQRMSKNGVILVHDCACSTNKNPHEQHWAVYSAVQNFIAESGKWRVAFCVDSTMVLVRV